MEIGNHPGAPKVPYFVWNVNSEVRLCADGARKTCDSEVRPCADVLLQPRSGAKTGHNALATKSPGRHQDETLSWLEMHSLELRANILSSTAWKGTRKPYYRPRSPRSRLKANHV